jgi:ubiquinone/menaquinone biosynthesis C-methylase UbiE
MSTAARQAHWQNVYTTKAESEVSWFEDSPAISLKLIKAAGASQTSAIIDVGGGASRLVDTLIDLGYQNVTVLDLSAAALTMAETRMGDKSQSVRWIVADATTWQPSAKCYDVWHDRAAFHFLTDEYDRRAYVARLKEALRPGGTAIIGSFSLDGPEKCSGLPVQRYDAVSLGQILGPSLSLVETLDHEHRTPWGSIQKFQFSRFVFDPKA